MSQQLVKKKLTGGYENVMPKSWIEAIKDKNTGQTLVEILQGFNMYFLPYNGNTSATRCLVPTILRKKGLWITYVKYDGNVYTEWYAADGIDDKSWGDSSNWRIGNNTLVGDITISANGNWVINGIETEFKAVGEKGNTPLIRVANNRLQVSYDLGDTYRDVTDNPVYTKFRWLATSGDTQANNVGRIQASTDEGKTWTNMSNDFINNLHISKYIGADESLPTSGIAEGTIYAKGPTYAVEDTSNSNPIYRLWVYAWKGNTLAWQDNGEFTSIAAGIVQETGNNENAVMSQKATSAKFSQLGQKPDIVHIISTDFSIAGLVRVDNTIVNSADSPYRRTSPFLLKAHNAVSVFAYANSANASLLSVFSDAQCTTPVALYAGEEEMASPKYYSFFNNSDNDVYVILTTKSPFVENSFGFYGADLFVSEIADGLINIQQEVCETSDVGNAITIHGVVQRTGTTVILDSSPYRLTDFIPVTSGQIIRFKTAVPSGAFGVSAYSSNDAESIIVDSPASVLGSYYDSALEDYQIVIPNGVKYIRICRDSRVVSNGTVTLTYVLSGLTKEVDLLKAQTTQIEGDVDTLQNIVNNIDNHYSVLQFPQTQPRKGFIAWCMDCGVNFFFNESKEYDKKLIEAGYNNTTYAVLPADLSTQSKRELVKYFFDLGREMVIHSDARIYDTNSEKEYEELVQTYFKEMNDSGITPSGGWINLGGNTVPYMNMLKKYVGWGQTGPKNYDIISDNEYMLGVNTLDTEPTHLMRLFIEQTPEQVTEEITNKIINRAKEVIDLAANNGSYIIFYTHSYNRPNAVYTLYPEVFDAILDYIKEKHSKGLINIGAVGDMIEYYYSKRYNE